MCIRDRAPSAVPASPKGTVMTLVGAAGLLSLAVSGNFETLASKTLINATPPTNAKLVDQLKPAVMSHAAVGGMTTPARAKHRSVVSSMEARRAGVEVRLRMIAPVFTPRLAHVPMTNRSGPKSCHSSTTCVSRVAKNRMA